MRWRFCLPESWFSEIDSTPAPMAMSVPSVMICCAAMATVWRPDEQKRLTVTPEVVTGQPAHIAARRPILLPVAPSGAPQPI